MESQPQNQNSGIILKTISHAVISPGSTVSYYYQLTPSTMQSLYNTSCYNTDLDIHGYVAAPHFFPWNFTKEL